MGGSWIIIQSVPGRDIGNVIDPNAIDDVPGDSGATKYPDPGLSSERAGHPFLSCKNGQPAYQNRAVSDRG